MQGSARVFVEGVRRGGQGMSAVPQEAVVVSQGDLVGVLFGIPTVSTRRRRGLLMRSLLVLTDVGGFLASDLITLVLDPPATNVETVSPALESVLFVAKLPVWVLIL